MTMSKEATATEACACWSAPEYAELGNKIKMCKIAETADVAKGLKACKDAFSTCRKFEDDAVSSMAACSVSTDALKSKAAALSANVDSANAAAQKVAAATSCAGFISLVAQLVTILLDSPASPEVIVVGGYIVASADPSCTEEEIASLVETETSLEEAAEFLVEALEEAQANLLEATGSTLSASELLEFTDAPTTVASRFRMRGFQ